MKKILLILFMGVLLGVLVYGARNYSSTQKSANRVDFFKKSKEVKETLKTIAPEEKPDFARDGHLVLKNEGGEMESWTLLYDEPGQLALIVTLDFNNRSKCDYGNGEQICNKKKFERGLRAHVEGYKNSDLVTVTKLKILKE